MVSEELKMWSDFLSLVLWAYHTSKRTLTQVTLISLVYGAEVVVLVEIVVPSARLALASASKVLDPDGRAYDVETLEKKRRNAENRWQVYQDQISGTLQQEG